MTSEIRVRYGRLNNRMPKNTLVTIKDGDKIYFGIARCHSKMDKFRKDIGIKTATIRAESAYRASNGKTYSDGVGEISLNKSGLLGVATMNSIKTLLNYFQNIDKFSLV